VREYINRNDEKYIILTVILMLLNGGSAGFAPSQVRIKNDEIKAEVFILIEGLNFELEIVFFFDDRIDKIIILITRAITPPSLFGIARRIAYANRKYHSG